MNTQFRGKVQLSLASIFPISDKSGVNQKGLYNLNNTIITDKSEVKTIDLNFYKQFWILIRYMSNPFMVLFL